MFDFRSSLSVLTLYVVIDSFIRATAQNIPVSPREETKTITTEPKMIIYGMSSEDEPEQLKCECVLFSECSDENYISLPTADSNGEECPIPDVCCKRSVPSSTPLEPTSTPSNNNELSEDHKPEDLECECKAFYLCPANSVTDLITNDNEKNHCPFPDVCCKKSNSVPPLSSQPNQSKNGFWKTSHTIKHTQVTKCECKPPHQCTTKDAKTPKNVNLQCSGSKTLCCETQESSEHTDNVPDHISGPFSETLDTIFSKISNSQKQPWFSV